MYSYENLTERNNKAKAYSENCRKKRFEAVYNRFVNCLIILTLCFITYCLVCTVKAMYV